MAIEDKELTSLTELITPAAGDKQLIVDISDPTDSGGGTSKRITLQNIANWLATLVQTLTNKTLTSPIINYPSILQKVTSYTPAAGSTVTLDVSDGGIHSILMPAGNITIAVANEVVGKCFMVEITQDDVGSRTVTLFTTIKWDDDEVPVLTITANKRDVLGFRVTGEDAFDGYIMSQNK